MRQHTHVGAAMVLTLLPYLRVSEDDKGQEPLRQLDVIRPWAARECVQLLDPPEIDEGTSASKTSPLQRPRFIAACERARAAGADGIVVECSDRFSRQGSKLDAHAEVEVGKIYGLKVYRADKPIALHGSTAGNVSDSINAESAHAWAKGHAEKVRTGMARKKKAGARFGRPAKPLTRGEIDLVLKLRARKPPVGWGTCARAICDARGAHRIVDPDVRRKAEVSGSHVRRAVLALPKVDPVQKV